MPAFPLSSNWIQPPSPYYMLNKEKGKYSAIYKVLNVVSTIKR
jgi:hypothetical protein